MIITTIFFYLKNSSGKHFTNFGMILLDNVRIRGEQPFPLPPLTLTHTHLNILLYTFIVYIYLLMLYYCVSQSSLSAFKYLRTVNHLCVYQW